jgi:hypothetical protein
MPVKDDLRTSRRPRATSEDRRIGTGGAREGAPQARLTATAPGATAIARRHFNGHRWRWQLSPVDGGARTEVTETFDSSTARWPLLLSVSGFRRRNQRAIATSLDNLDAIVAPQAWEVG